MRCRWLLPEPADNRTRRGPGSEQGSSGVASTTPTPEVHGSVSTATADNSATATVERCADADEVVVSACNAPRMAMPPTPNTVTAMIASTAVLPRSVMGWHRNDGLGLCRGKGLAWARLGGRMIRTEDAGKWHTREVAVNR